MCDRDNLKQKDLTKLIIEANNLQDLNRDLSDSSKIKSIEQYFSTELERSFSSEDLYTVAEEMGINSTYVKSVLDKYYPSTEEQISNLVKLNANPSKELIIQQYNKHLLASLENKYPSEKFEGINRDNWGGYSSRDFKIYLKRISRIPSPTFFNKNRIKEYESSKILAEVDYWGSYNLVIHDPMFLPVCIETLDLLDKKFSKWISRGSVESKFLPEGFDSESFK